MSSALPDASAGDLRAIYRATVCAGLPADGPPCAELLPEPAPTALAAPILSNEGAHRYRLVFVPGLFAQCLDPIIRPFDDAMAHLVELGFDVDYLQVGGRSGAAANAEMLAEQFAALQLDPKPTLVFAYSKAIVDLGEMMIAHPGADRDIAAIVSVAGTVYGSPLADQLAEVYQTWIAWLPMPACAPSDGGELEALRPDVRRAWWRAHGESIEVPMFSLVAVPQPCRVSPILALLHEELAEIDPRNDGAVLQRDALVPGSYLLAYVNADHLSLVLPLRQQMPGWRLLYRDEVPRAALIEAAVRVVAATLAGQLPAEQTVRPAWSKP